MIATLRNPICSLVQARLSALKPDQKEGLNERQQLHNHERLQPISIFFRNVASFAEAYKRRKEFMSELNDRIK